ncbi:MAG: glutamate--tRNA ligase [Bacteroidetes bacterium GWF2_49_14]|nr:MAG: glutamate--tRNA ligase [Bacteroidetes bacterium GWF2_49_14]HBB91518.1 glutamate--tRNA ligase [Bacteroidales bacterium]
MSVRVRFAPSPTGPLHMGGVRTALFNYLFARKHDGVMILRIEDTDQGRFVPGAEEYIMESLEWCGIYIDEGIREGGAYGPYRQSDRKHLYKQYADELLENGWAYYAFDSAEDLESMRKDFESRKETFSYDNQNRKILRNSLTLPENEVNRLLTSGENYVIRFKMPENEEIVMFDLIRGEVRVNTNTLDDKVLFKSDGMPTYHLANVVDDHLMEITHVIRGEEWLPSMPLHVMLYRAFGWTVTMPEFAHLPLILKPSGNGKLSKRDGDKLGFPVFPINWNNPETGEVYSGYREAGYFNDAFVNILALLGWNDGTDKEIYTMEELVDAFSLERVGTSGSRFDPDKAKWFNHQYMLMKSDEEIAELFINAEGTRLKAQGKAEGAEPAPGLTWGHKAQVMDMEWEKVVKIISLVKERAEFVKDLWSQAWFFFEAPVSYDETTIKKRWTPEIPSILELITSLLTPYLSPEPCVLSPEPCAPGSSPGQALSPQDYETLIKGHIAANNLNMGQVMNILRLCLVGSPMGPGVFDIMALLGPDEVVARIERAVGAIVP